MIISMLVDGIHVAGRYGPTAVGVNRMFPREPRPGVAQAGKTRGANRETPCCPSRVVVLLSRLAAAPDQRAANRWPITSQSTTLKKAVT